MLRYTALFAIACLVLGVTACRKAPPVERTYSLKGVIVGVDSQTKTVTIKHEKIGDWMDAMTMDFPVRDAVAFAKLAPGQKITATVHTRPETFDYWIGEIHVEAP